MKKRTDWYPGYVNPDRPGPYQRLWDSGNIDYAMWDGVCWRMGSRTPRDAARAGVVSVTQTLHWRGLCESS